MQECLPVSELGGAGKLQCFAAFRVAEGQVFRVQQQAAGLVSGCCVGVKRVAQDRVAKGLHMYTKLVSAAGFWRKFNARAVRGGVVTQHAVER